MYRRLFSFIVVLFVVMNAAYAQEEHWMPDPNLRKVVRAELNIPEGTPLMKVDMQRLPRVVPERVKITGEISDLTGLEYAVNLYSLLLGKHHVQDLRPIANLTNLRYLSFDAGQISDITPLAGLVNLETLGIERNQIVDVSPLANLINLRDLKLAFNQIEDFSPLTGLVNLGRLRVTHNRSSDISMIPTSGLEVLAYDETCNTAGIPISNRIENREYPSVSGVWSYVPNKPPVIPTPETSEIKPNAYFDLRVAAAPQTLRLGWAFNQPGSDEAVRLIATGTANIEDAKQRREAILAFNPNAILLVQILYYTGLPARLYPEDGVLRDLFLRDKNGNRIAIEDGPAFLDFTLPDTQAFVFDQIRAIKACGLFDGIFFDFWGGGQTLQEAQTGRTQAEEDIARDRIIQEARDIVGDDMLILVNTGERKIPRWAEYINGTFMETHPIAVKIEGTDKYHHIGYTRDDLLDIEDTLVWSEAHFREPRINVLQGQNIDVEPPDSPRNKQWMRTFTTMSLTLSDGYVQYLSLRGTYGPEVHWHPFYDAPLGRPIGGDETKGQLYKSRKDVPIEGVFIREYTNGWAVYNRSGKERKIYLPETVSSVASGVKNKHWHTLPDLDGEIYLKTNPTNELKGANATEVTPAWDVNEDGSINKADLLLVTADIGVDTPTTPRADVNADGQINVIDLQLVIDNLDDKTTAEAPALGNNSLMAFNAELLRAELNRIGTDAYAFSEAIRLLQQLLANIRPQKTVLLANYPNPFNPETWIPYHLAADTDVEIHIYDTQGSLVRHFELGHQAAGIYTGRGRAAYWDGRNDVGERVASGIYFYQLQADNMSLLRKMVILK